jgi:uncharacterized protein YhfF
MTSVDIASADQTAVDAMWASYVADSGYDRPVVTAFAFGDSAELADELGLLVLHGPKRATAELVQAFVAQDQPLPRAGDRCLVLSGDGRPLAIVRTTDVRVGPLSSVDDRFAWDEGEGDRTRAWWLEAHALLQPSVHGDGLDVLRRYRRGLRAVRAGLANDQNLDLRGPRETDVRSGGSRFAFRIAPSQPHGQRHR